jgi:diaminopimelate decarboxylase
MKNFKHQSLSYNKNSLIFDQHCLNTITKALKTPFYLYSIESLERNFISFRDTAKNYGIHNPLVCFALKANPNLELLKKLKRLGCGADIVSGGELKQALKAGISPTKIVFSGVGKTRDEITLALKSHPNGIYSFNVESIEELEMIGEVAQSLKMKARVALRLNPEVNAKTHKHISTGGLGHKFGLLRSDIEKSLKKKSLYKHVKLVGLSMHIGSQLTCLKATKKALKELCELALSCDRPLEFLDVGGGLGVPYFPGENISPIDEYMKDISEVLNKYYYAKKGSHLPTPSIVFEPGRYIVANAGVLVTEVIRTKVSGPNKFLIVDAGMNDFVRSSLYDAYHHVLPIKKRVGKKQNVNIVGPICETADSFAKDREIGPVKSSDILCVADVGAYGFSMSSNYNMRERIKEYVVDQSGRVK